MCRMPLLAYRSLNSVSPASSGVGSLLHRPSTINQLHPTSLQLLDSLHLNSRLAFHIRGWIDQLFFFPKQPYHIRGQQYCKSIRKENMSKHKKVQLPQDWFGTPIWPQFHCCKVLDTNMAGVTSCENARLAVTRLRRKKGTCCPN